MSTEKVIKEEMERFSERGYCVKKDTTFELGGGHYSVDFCGTKGNRIIGCIVKAADEHGLEEKELDNIALHLEALKQSTKDSDHDLYCILLNVNTEDRKIVQKLLEKRDISCYFNRRDKTDDIKVMMCKLESKGLEELEKENAQLAKQYPGVFERANILLHHTQYNNIAVYGIETPNKEKKLRAMRATFEYIRETQPEKILV